MSFLAARLRILNLTVFSLEATSLCLVAHLLFHKILGSIFPVDATRIPLGRPLDDCADLREGGHFTFSGILLVVPVGIEDVSHLNELQVALEGAREFSLGEVEPVGTGIGLVILRGTLALCYTSKTDIMGQK